MAQRQTLHDHTPEMLRPDDLTGSPPAKIAGELQNDFRAYITFMKLWKGTEHNGLR